MNNTNLLKLLYFCISSQCIKIPPLEPIVCLSSRHIYVYTHLENVNLAL